MQNECYKCPYTTTRKHIFGDTYHCNLEPTNMDVTYHYNHKTPNALCPFVCEGARFPGVDYGKYEV